MSQRAVGELDRRDADHCELAVFGRTVLDRNFSDLPVEEHAAGIHLERLVSVSRHRSSVDDLEEHEPDQLVCDLHAVEYFVADVELLAGVAALCYRARLVDPAGGALYLEGHGDVFGLIVR